MTHKCGPCGVSDESKKEKCPQTKKESGFSKTPCNASKNTKPGCHPTVEKFKSGNFPSAEDAQKCKCTSTSQDCHESYKKFRQKESSHEDKTVVDCSSSFSKAETTEENVVNPCSQQKPEPPCSNAFQKLSSNTQEGACGGNGSSIYSKITSTCKNLARDFVKLKSSKPICPENSLKYPIPDKKDLPFTTLPCPPKAEKGLEKDGLAKCSGAKLHSGPCPDKTPPSWTDFFPLDARNEKLNACIEKYTKIDSSQVIAKCSQFANVTLEEDDKCLKKAQERCVGAMPSSKISSQKPRLEIPVRYSTLMRRWAPSAAIYLSATALYTLYLTEWKPVLRYVPLYASYVRELEQSESKS